MVTRAEVLAEIQRRQSSPAPQAITRADVMAEINRRQAGAQTQPEQSIGRTILDQGLQGATFGIADEVSDRLGATFAKGYDKISGLLGGNEVLADKSIGDVYDDARQASSQRLKAQVEQNPVTAIASNIGGGLLTGAALSTTKAANMFRGGNTGAKIAKGAAAGALSAGAYGYGAGEGGAEERLKSAGEAAIYGAGFGGAIPIAGAALRGASEAVVPVIDDALKPLAKRAQDFNIPLRLDQISPTRARRTVQKVSQELPFSGVNNLEDAQRGAWNKALAGTLGMQADNLSPEVIEQFRKQNGAVFGSVSQGKIFKPQPAAIAQIDNILEEAKASISDDLVKVVDANANLLKSVFWQKTKGGTTMTPKVTGEKLASIRSSLIKRQAKAQGEAKAYIGDLIDVIDDTIESGLDGAQKQALSEARRQYRNYKTIEPLLERSTDGLINPTDLLNRTAANRFINGAMAKIGDDDLVDLARIGKQFLPKTGGSDTFQKSALGGGIVGGALQPAIIPEMVAGAATNRAFQSLYNNSQSLVNKAINRSASNPAKSAIKPSQAGMIAGNQQMLERGGATPMPAFDTPNNPSNFPYPREQTTLEITPQNYNTSMEAQTPQSDFTQMNEGRRLSVYNDTMGNPTIGYGFNFNSGIAPKVWKAAGVATRFHDAKAGRAAITSDEAVSLYRAANKVAEDDARAFYPRFDKLSENQKTALKDLSYQLGMVKLVKFKGLKAGLEKGDSNMIYRSIMDSKLAQQTPERASKVAQLLIMKD